MRNQTHVILWYVVNKRGFFMEQNKSNTGIKFEEMVL